MSLSSDVALGVRVVRGVAYRPVTLRALAPTAGGRVADAIRSGGKVGGADLVSLAVSIGAGTYTPPPPPQPVVPPQTALEGLAENKAVGAVVSLAQGDVGGAIGGIASAAVEPILGVIDTARWLWHKARDNYEEMLPLAQKQWMKHAKIFGSEKATGLMGPYPTTAAEMKGWPHPQKR